MGVGALSDGLQHEELSDGETQEEEFKKRKMRGETREREKKPKPVVWLPQWINKWCVVEGSWALRAAVWVYWKSEREMEKI